MWNPISEACCVNIMIEEPPPIREGVFRFLYHTMQRQSLWEELHQASGHASPNTIIPHHSHVEWCHTCAIADVLLRRTERRRQPQHVLLGVRRRRCLAASRVLHLEQTLSWSVVLLASCLQGGNEAWRVLRHPCFLTLPNPSTSCFPTFRLTVILSISFSSMHFGTEGLFAL